MEKIYHSDRSEGKVLLDSVLYGFGFCCLQVTFSSNTMDEARWLNDQYHMFTPLFMALGASTPIMKGKLLSTDSRYEMLNASGDDRSERELPGTSSGKGLQKSRNSPLNYFISNDERNCKGLNDNPYTISIRARKYITKMAKELDVKLDRAMINHLSYICVRDNLTVFPDNLEDKDSTTDHFE